MAQNLTDEYRKFRYYEGICSSSDFVKEIAKVLTLGVKSDPETDGDGNIIKASAPIKIKNWDIVYPLVSKDFSFYDNLCNRDVYLNERNGYPALGEEDRISKLNNQIDQIKDVVVLRTTTTPKDISDQEKDDLSVSPDSDLATTSMYLQIWKPKYLANPEEYPLDAENYGLTPQVITKDMYMEARKSTASVLFDLSLLKNDSKSAGGLVTSEPKREYIDAVSNAFSRSDLFDATLGVLNGLKVIFNKSDLNSIIEEPSPDSRVKSCILGKGHLNAIKQTNVTLYNFLFGICNLRTTFTETDYDLIENMKMMITATGSAEDMSYYVTLSFYKNVEIFTIGAGNIHSLVIADEYGEDKGVALETLAPELYSEGRYIPLPAKYLGNCTNTNVAFNPDEPLKFCLDKVVDKDVLYGTIVLRYSYEKKDNNYTDISSLKITDSVALENNHYCLMRIFDNPNFDFSGPEPNIYDNEGNITATNSHTSPWSKLSWYQDFEEVMMDHLDEDVSVTSVTDGTLLVPLITAGLTSDTRISYWINTNNDRFSLIVMGNPALDYERDRHLISSCYCGRIESFDNSINDISGNFALYTSSSTTPCKTMMSNYDTQYPINRDFQEENFRDENPVSLKTVDPTKYPNAVDRLSNVKAYTDYCEKIGGVQDPANLSDQGFDQYFITLTGNKFFNESQQPSYMIVNGDGVPLNIGTESNPKYYSEVPYRNYIYGTSDSRSNQILIYLPHWASFPANTKIYFNFGYYEQKFIIESGITRDIFGNVIDITTDDTYGKNTSDGTTSVSMYHTRSRAFYQKHHFLFATTEEYMSKVMYGKSSYTGEYYADRIKITHGNDGPRGILSDTLVIDNSSLYPKDELVINKDFEKSPNELEETFVYFPVTAPFSPLSDGPNSRYGLALKKSEREPKYEDNNKIIRIARNELNTIMTNNQIIRDNTVLPSQTSNGCKVYWDVVDEINGVKQNWIEIDNDSGKQYERIVCEFADSTTREYLGQRYEARNIEVVVDGFTSDKNNSGSALNVECAIAKANGDNKKTKDFESYVTLTPNEAYTIPQEITNILYGYSDSLLTGIHAGTQLTYIVNDGTKFNNMHEYSYLECNVDIKHLIDKNDISSNNIITSFEQKIYNAHPSKYLNIFFTEDSSNVVGTNKLVNDTEEEWYNKLIKHYISVPLAPNNWTSLTKETLTPDNSYFSILQYPCCLTAYTSGVTNTNLHGILVNSIPHTKYDFLYCPYNQQQQIKVQGLTGEVTLMFGNHGFKYDKDDGIVISGSNINIPANLITDDLYVSISKD